jgi:hypothetical protein
MIRTAHRSVEYRRRNRGVFPYSMRRHCGARSSPRRKPGPDSRAYGYWIPASAGMTVCRSLNPSRAALDPRVLRHAAQIGRHGLWPFGSACEYGQTPGTGGQATSATRWVWIPAFAGMTGHGVRGYDGPWPAALPEPAFRRFEHNSASLSEVVHSRVSAEPVLL